MAINVQWATGFEDGGGDRFIGWESGYNGTDASNFSSNRMRWSTSTSVRHLRGASAYTDVPGFASPVSGQFLRRPATDHNKMVLAFAMRYRSSSENNSRVGFTGLSGETIDVGIRNVGSNVWRISLYINDALVSTGSAIDFYESGGFPWVYVELVVDKLSSTVTVKAGGVSECSGTMPGGFTAEFCAVRAVGSTTSPYLDDIVHYIDSDPVGIIKVDGYYKDGDVMSGFYDGTDGGSSGTTGVNSTDATNYRACSTPGAEDRFSYSAILPSGVTADSIVAVIPSLLVSSGSYENGNIEASLVSGATEAYVDIEASAKPFYPQYVQAGVFHTDPDTGLEWTRAGVQAIQTGYKVKE